MTTLQLTLCGAFQATRGSQELAELRTNRLRAIIGYLALESGRAHERSHLASLFWPDSPEDQAMGALRQSLHRIGRVLGGDDASGATPLLVSRTTVQLDPRQIDVDVLEIERQLYLCDAHRHRSIAGCDACAVRLHDAVTLYRGELLAGTYHDGSDLFEAWLRERRERLARQVCDALRALATHQLRRRAYAEAARSARAWLQLEPWQECAHRLLIEALARDGQRAAALRQIDRCRKVLHDELGATPEEATVMLAAHVRRGTLESADALPLPAAREDAVVGRAADIAWLHSQLADTTHRWITIVGPGGVGKTALVQHVAGRMAPSFAEGVRFVALDDVADLADAAYAIGRALGQQFSGGDAPADALPGAIAHRDVLLVLDGVDRLAPYAAWFARLIEVQAGPTLILTSRRRLGSRAELVLMLGGLATPAPDAPPEASCDAVELFLARAMALQPMRDWHAERAAIQRICRAVDGSPLGIELAVSQARAVHCQDLANVIERRLQLLGGTELALPERHHRLLAVFDEIWQGMAPPQRAVLQALSLFSGEFSWPAATALAAAVLVEPDADAAVLRTLTELADQALVHTRPNQRYRMHVLLRQSVAAMLDADAERMHQLRAAHQRWFLGMLDAALLGAVNRRARRYAATLADAFADIRSAWEWAVAADDGAALDRAASPLVVMASCIGRYRDGASMMHAAATALAARAGDGQPARRRCVRLLLGAAELYRSGGAFGQMAEAVALARALAAADDGSDVLLPLLVAEGTVAYALGQRAEAVQLLTAAHARCDGSTDPAIVAQVEHQLGITLMFLGDLEASGRCMTAALAWYQQRDDAINVLQCLTVLAQLPARSGDLRAALPLLEDVLVVARELDDPRSLAVSLVNVGSARAVLGFDDTTTVHQLEESLAIVQQLGDQTSLAGVLHAAAYGFIHLGRYPIAEHLLARALRMVDGERATPVLLELLEGVGTFGAHTARHHQAAMLLALVVAHPTTTEFVRQRAARVLHALQVPAADDDIAAAAEAGARLDPLAARRRLLIDGGPHLAAW
jgi:DNA-binding SARP family transcriptional activator/predicted ATPase